MPNASLPNLSPFTVPTVTDGRGRRPHKVSLSVTVYPQHRDILSHLGGGNVSLGIQIAVSELLRRAAAESASPKGRV